MNPFMFLLFVKTLLTCFNLWYNVIENRTKEKEWRGGGTQCEKITGFHSSYLPILLLNPFTSP